MKGNTTLNTTNLIINLVLLGLFLLLATLSFQADSATGASHENPSQYAGLV
jgi:hypothetical protein